MKDSRPRPPKRGNSNPQRNNQQSKSSQQQQPSQSARGPQQNRGQQQARGVQQAKPSQQARGPQQGQAPQQNRGSQQKRSGQQPRGQQQPQDRQQNRGSQQRRSDSQQNRPEQQPRGNQQQNRGQQPVQPQQQQLRGPSKQAREVSPALHWRDGLGVLLADANYQPMDEQSLVRKLRVPQEDATAFSEFLKSEEATGRIMQVRHTLYVLPKRLGFSVGNLQMNERGFGFLVPIDKAEQDFYIAGEDTLTALHGDLVLARIKEQRGGGRQRDSRLRGEVVKVLQRKRRQLVGTLRKTPLLYYVLPDESRIPYDICVPAPEDPAALGQKVVVELKDWPNRHTPPEGVVVEILGAPDAPGVDLLSIIRKHDLPTSFPEAVEQEAADIPAQIPESEIARREDFRTLFTLTIDPDDAKDFDDALSYRIHPDGDFEIFVHIADVSNYVRTGSALDVEAQLRGNSVYLVDRVIPMLPEKLSNGICSLQPDVDRLVKTAIVRLGKQGEIKSFRFAEGIIHSRKRFTYQEAFALLKKPPTTALGRHLHDLNTMAQALRKKRFAIGALDLDFPEVKVRVNELGIPTHLERTENDISHQLIEEFMLLANEVVALELKRRGRPAIYRIHENPDPERLLEFRAQAKSMGFACGDLTQRGEIQKLLTRVAGQPGESVVKIGLLRSLKRAMYSPKPLGHYGLSKSNYTHFTSPIRRYSDFLVHRLLFEAPGAATEFTYDTISRLAAHLSLTERAASEAEQESVKLKKLEYFDRQAHATKRTSFSALILEVRSSGLMVQLPEFLVQGLVHLSALEGDLFVFDPQRLELRGQRSKVTLRAGQTLQVEVATVDLARHQVDFRVRKQSLLKMTVRN